MNRRQLRDETKMSTDYAEEVLAGSPRALARLITWLENEDERAAPCMGKLYPHTGSATILGITGSPGAGKSSLTDKITRDFREKGLTVGIVAVDPTSPFTGGAVLGDRVRMTDLSADSGIFMRSMATRGFLGGLAQATENVVRAMDAFGKDIVIVETVGVGQDEVDVIRIADTVCLVLVPGMGDVIQSMKAGVMEIADIYVINKSDHPGADQLFSEVSFRVAQDAILKERSWTPPVVQTVGTDKRSLGPLFDALGEHRRHLGQSGELLEKRRVRVRQETLQMIHHELYRRLRGHLTANGRMDKLIDAILEKEENPYSVMQRVIAEFIKEPAARGGL